MPRRHRAARDRGDVAQPVPRPFGVAPHWAQVDGVFVQEVRGQKGKTYRCPGCQQDIRPGTPHLVVMEEGDVEGRRHWHTPCWRTELKLGKR